jgi:hypothetical protein
LASAAAAGRSVDRIDIKTKIFVKQRVDTDLVEPCRAINIFRRDRINFERSQAFIGDVRILAVQGLATDNDNCFSPVMRPAARSAWSTEPRCR